MGQDLAKKAVPTFTKAWDRERAALKRRDLLTQIPEAAKLALLVQLQPDVHLEPGQPIQLHVTPDGPVVERDLAPVGTVIEAPAQLRAVIDAGATYIQAEVLSVHPEAEVAEIVLK